MERRRPGRMLIPALLAIATAAIYVPRLQDAPLYVAHDEIVYSLNAHALASTGRDLSGRFMPMYIEYPARFGRPTWDQPMLIYAIAATLKVLPFSEFAIRLPMVLAAIVDVLLIYFVGKVLFESERFAVAAALLLALTPAHFMHSRMATDFQLSVPFVLAWLLCLALYLRHGGSRLLFAAGVVLGTSVYGYVASYLLVPIFALLTCVTVYQRREPIGRCGLLAAGLALPSVLCLPWILRYPLPFRDVIAHYAVVSGAGSNRAGAFVLIKDFVTSRLLGDVPSVFASFWDPQFLFIDGPLRSRSTQEIGVFLLPVAGLLMVGLVLALRRRSPFDLLLLIGFLTAPLPASFAGEGQAIWRALHMAPFGVLLVVAGLQQLSDHEPTGARRTAVVATFGIVIGLATWYHDFLPHAQALVRASTVPLAVTGLAVLLRHLALDRLSVRQIAVVAVIVLVSTHVAFFVADHATTVGVVLLTAISLATVLARTPDRLRQEPLLGVALLALVTSQFMYVYVDYGQLHRWGFIPASLVILAMRLTCTSVALAAAIGVAMLMNGDMRNRFSGGLFLAVASLWIVSIQLTYFFVDYFADYRLRFIQVAVVLAAVVGLAMLLRSNATSVPSQRFVDKFSGARRPAGKARGARISGIFERRATQPAGMPGPENVDESLIRDTSRLGLGQITMAALFGIASIQFTLFYVDYFTGFHVRGSADHEGNAQVAFEAVIERTANGSVPVIYLGRIGPYAFGDQYWKFFLIKHRREDLMARTIPDLGFNPDRIRMLPAGSVVITSPTQQIDTTIDEMMTKGELEKRKLLKAPDGSPIFWILETGRR